MYPGKVAQAAALSKKISVAIKKYKTSELGILDGDWRNCLAITEEDSDRSTWLQERQ